MTVLVVHLTACRHEVLQSDISGIVCIAKYIKISKYFTKQTKEL